MHIRITRHSHSLSLVIRICIREKNMAYNKHYLLTKAYVCMYVCTYMPQKQSWNKTTAWIYIMDIYMCVCVCVCMYVCTYILNNPEIKLQLGYI